VLISKVSQTHGLGKPENWDQTAGRHEVVIVEPHRGPANGVRESHLEDALL